MDLKDQLLEEHSKRNGMLVAKEVSLNHKNIDKLIKLCLTEKVFQQRASQSLSYAVEHFKVKLTAVQLSKLIQLLKNEDLHDAVPRNTLKILDLQTDFPEDDEGFLFDFCTSSIMNPQKPIAVRAFSVPIAYAVAMKYPELKNELEQVLLSLSDLEGPGMNFRKTKYLKLLQS